MRVDFFFVRSNNDVLWWQIRDGDSQAITARTHKPQNTNKNTYIHMFRTNLSLEGGDERINSPHHHNHINATRALARSQCVKVKHYLLHYLHILIIQQFHRISHRDMLQQQRASTIGEQWRAISHIVLRTRTPAGKYHNIYHGGCHVHV